MKFRGILTLLMFLVLAGNSAHAIIFGTLIDFTEFDSLIQTTFTNQYSYVTYENGQPRAVLGWNEYIISNWTVVLNSSASDIQNRMLSYCQPVPTTYSEFENLNILGVRIHFPSWNNNSLAEIKPAFPIKVYDDEGKYINVNNGVLTNAWEIKSMSVWVNGRGFDYQLAVRLRDRDSNIHEYSFGSLNFQGWRQLVWENPNFPPTLRLNTLDSSDVGPAYPKDMPYYVFDSIVIYRHATQIGGDFVTYIGRVDVEYTPYIVENNAATIDDEAAWHIIRERGEIRQMWESQQLIQEIMGYERQWDRYQD